MRGRTLIEHLAGRCGFVEAVRHDARSREVGGVQYLRIQQVLRLVGHLG